MAVRLFPVLSTSSKAKLGNSMEVKIAITMVYGWGAKKCLNLSLPLQATMYLCTIYHKTAATALLRVLTQWGSHTVVLVKPILELYNNKPGPHPRLEEGKQNVCQ